MSTACEEVVPDNSFAVADLERTSSQLEASAREALGSSSALTSADEGEADRTSLIMNYARQQPC